METLIAIALAERLSGPRKRTFASGSTVTRALSVCRACWLQVPREIELVPDGAATVGLLRPDLRRHTSTFASSVRVSRAGGAWRRARALAAEVAHRPRHRVAGERRGRDARLVCDARGGVLGLTCAFLTVAVAAAAANAAEKNLSAAIRERLTLQVRDRLLGHLLTLSPTIRTTHRSGEIVLRIVDDTDLFVACAHQDSAASVPARSDAADYVCCDVLGPATRRAGRRHLARAGWHSRPSATRASLGRPCATNGFARATSAACRRKSCVG